MIFGLYITIALFCVILVILGLALSEYGGLAMIGFAIFFIISVIMLTGNIEIKSGESLLTNYTYNGSNILSTEETMSYQYTDWSDKYSKQIGFWSLIGSAFGFIFMLFSINKSKRKEAEL